MNDMQGPEIMETMVMVYGYYYDTHQSLHRISIFLFEGAYLSLMI